MLLHNIFYVNQIPAASAHKIKSAFEHRTFTFFLKTSKGISHLSVSWQKLWFQRFRHHQKYKILTPIKPTSCFHIIFSPVYYNTQIIMHRTNLRLSHTDIKQTQSSNRHGFLSTDTSVRCQECIIPGCVTITGCEGMGSFFLHFIDNIRWLGRVIVQAPRLENIINEGKNWNP